MRLKILVTRFRQVITWSSWLKGSLVQHCYKAIVVGLICLTIAHASHLLSQFFDKKIRIDINVEFYNEQRPLKFPNFLVCISKVFTYTRLSNNDIDWLYSSATSALNRTKSIKYSWEVALEHVITGVIFKRKLWSAKEFFQPLFVSAKETCWVTKESDFMSGQSGRLYTLDLIINAAVFDDVIVEYNSPLTHVKIVPYYGDAKYVPDMRSSVYVSPGRLTTVGFELYKIDSSVRKKDDEKCYQLAFSKDNCITSAEKRMIRDTCNICDGQKNISVSTFFRCALHRPVNYQHCLINPCKFDLFRFTKSESFIKFDNQLSNVRVNKPVLSAIKQNLRLARNLHSKFNPDVKKSFVRLAWQTGALSSQIAETLVRNTGYQCINLDNSKLMTLKQHRLPDTYTEYARITIMRNRYITLANKLFSTIAKTLLATGTDNMGVVAVTAVTPVFYLSETKNAIIPLDVHTGLNAQQHISKYTHSINFILTSFAILRRQASFLLETYSSLAFTAFIDTYGTGNGLAQYYIDLENAKSAVNKIRDHLFHGIHRSKLVFAYEDELVQTLHSRHPLVTVDWPSTYANNFWIWYPWQVTKNRHNMRDTLSIANPPFVEIVYGRSADLIHVPVVVELFCYAYHNYIKASEILYGSAPAFSILLSGAQFKPLTDYVVFALGELFRIHETSALFDIRRDGIVGAERRACARMAGYPIYALANDSYKAVEHQILRALYASRSFNFYRDGRMVDNGQTAATATLQIFNMFQNYWKANDAFISNTRSFNDRYKSRVVPTVGVMFNKVVNIRSFLKSYRRLRFIDNTHKGPLSNRLMHLGRLITDVIGGAGEEEISKFLSKKGKILVDEIRNEIGETMQHVQSEISRFKNSIEMTNLDDMLRSNDSFKFTLFRAVSTAFLDPDPSRQSTLIEQLNQCIYETRQQTLDHGSVVISDMSTWLTNMTLLVTRAKRYMKSTEMSRNFLRENMMHVSLFFQSMSVFISTSELTFEASELYPKIGAVCDIYIGVTVFDLLSLLTYLMTSFLKIIKKHRIRRR